MSSPSAQSSANERGTSARCAALWLALCSLPMALPAMGQAADARLRTVLYSVDEVYRLPARIGYELDLEFESGESFVGLGAGDVEALTFSAHDNHLFIKPKALSVHTNLTVLTNRRIYHFDYRAFSAAIEPDSVDILYALRFAYPSARQSASSEAVISARSSVQRLLAQTALPSARNSDYWYCGRSELEPIEAWDDGVHTHLRFSARSELPAVFVRNDDGSESLVNFSVEHDEIVVHRIAQRLVLRRGRLAGCIVNRGFQGSGSGLPLGTTSPEVERKRRGLSDEAVP